MGLSEDRNKLIRAMAELEGHRKNIGAAREKLNERAVEQYDSMPKLLDTLSDGLEKDQGGVLTQRRIRTALTERHRLGAIVHPHEHLRDPDGT
jgi:hypothetical protein